jgi:hypothetical protein
MISNKELYQPRETSGEKVRKDGKKKKSYKTIIILILKPI